MSHRVSIKWLTEALYGTYIEVGTKAYIQHYQDLWQNADSTPYLEHSFTEKVLLEEKKDGNTELFVIYADDIAVGILKLVKAKSVGEFTEEEAMLLDKIYLQKEYSRKGIGKEVLNFVVEKAKALNKKVVWLEAMKKGPAVHFYVANGFHVYSEKDHYSKLVIKEKRAMLIMVKAIV